MRDVQLYLKEIYSALNAILIFTDGFDLESFKSDDKTKSAVIRKFEIIGEAAKSIPNSLKEKYSLIPWKSLAGFRDVLIHNYFGIDDDLVWVYVQNEVQSLCDQIEQILVDYSQE